MSSRLLRTLRPLARIGRGFPGLVLLALGALGCTFGGYVPQEKVAPLETVERTIVNINPGERMTSELDCPSGQCRLRYRIMAPGQGTLRVRVDGPTGDGTMAGARIAQVALEGVGQQVLDVRYADHPPPLVVESPVRAGVHYLLVQGLGGHLIYDVEVSFVASGASPDAPEPGQVELTQVPAPPRPPPAVPGPGTGAQRPGDISDGADYAFDPRFDLKGLRRFAFADEPERRLTGEAAPDGLNPFLEKQIQREIRYYLANIGMYDTPADEADLLVAVDVGSRSTTWYSLGGSLYNRSYDAYFQQWTAVGAVIRAHNYVDGTLTIDLIDRRSGELVWHGWTTEPIALGEDSNKLIKQAVKKILDQYAP